MTDPSIYMPVAESNRLLSQNLAFEEAFEAELKTGFSKKIRETLYDIGVPPRLQKAVPEVVPSDIAALKVYQRFPEVGFGLVGPPGCGKSCALVHAIKKTMLAEWIAAGPAIVEEVKVKGMPTTQRTNPELHTQFRWIGWPAFAAKMKHYASAREWAHPEASTASLIAWVKADQDERRVLILDDVGMENLKPDAYTSEQLELLVDDCDGWEGRVFWTSNKTPEYLEAETRYGSRLVSRLCRLSPDAQLSPNLPDLRLTGCPR